MLMRFFIANSASIVLESKIKQTHVGLCLIQARVKSCIAQKKDRIFVVT